MLYLLKKLKASGADPSNPSLRGKYGTLSGAVGIALNIILFACKLAAALAGGSVAVIADAFNNLGDAGSSVVTMAGFRLSEKKPDPEHPFGHGRIEYITGFVVSIAIILMGFELGKSSIESIGGGQAPVFGTLTIVALAVSIVVKLYMFLYNRALARFFNSSAMKATSTDSLSDCVSTSAVLLALIISHYTHVQLDSYMGLLVSVFILYSGIMSAKETIEPLLGQAPDKEFVEQIERIVNADSAVVGMHDLVVHDYGPGRRMISLHAEIPSDMEVFAAHCVVDDLENELAEKLKCEAVIHYDPIDVNDERLSELKAVVREVIAGINPEITMHDLRYVPGPTHTNMVFDVVVPFDWKKTDTELKKAISQAVAERLPNHNCVIKCDKKRI